TIPLVVQREGTHYNAELELPKSRGKRSIKVFPRRGPSCRVELEKKGNRVTARTMGVKEFKFLLSPGHFDFSQPVEVVVNGVSVFSAQPKKDVNTLLKWAARDTDRSMLFAADVIVTVPPSQ
ncbi:MAG: hypothetical protein GY940_04130, partial [bacterium]|nr:hypothetical protein [bacterium]